MPPTINRYQQGETIFQEGYSGRLGFVIRRGRVELSIERDGRRLVIDSRKAGDSIGMIAPLLGCNRLATATAVEYTEAMVVEKSVLDGVLGKTNPVLRGMIHNMAEQLQRAVSGMSASGTLSNPVDSVAHILDLKARAVNGSKGSGEIVKLSRDEMAHLLKTTIGVTLINARVLLDQLARLNLITYDSNQRLYVKTGDILSMAKNISQNFDSMVMGAIKSESELISLSELSEELGVGKDVLQRKMSSGEMPEELWVFRKTEAMRIVQEKGVDFFKKRNIKKVEDFDSFEDIMFIDRETLAQVLSDMEPYRLATLLKCQDSELQERSLGVLSSRLQGILRETMAMIEGVDEMDAEIIGNEVIQHIKVLKGVDSSSTPVAS